MLTLFQTIPFKKFLVLTNLIYGQTNDGNPKRNDFDEWLPFQTKEDIWKWKVTPTASFKKQSFNFWVPLNSYQLGIVY